jgi:hypothetical protein
MPGINAYCDSMQLRCCPVKSTVEMGLYLKFVVYQSKTVYTIEVDRYRHPLDS